MKNIILVTIGLIGGYIVQAQSIDRKVIASGGGVVNAPTIQLSFTIGEIAVQYLSATGVILSQGFQQSSENTSGIRNINRIEAKLNVYPNPFVENIEVKSDKKLSHPTFSMIDATGRSIQIASKELENGKRWLIEISNATAGNYWLTIVAEGYKNTISLTRTTP